jgi:hypothetical protein
MRSSFARAALTAAATLVVALLPAQSAQAQKALVYCPVGIDDAGCSVIVSALAPLYLGGVDKGYDGSGGTIDLATVDLSAYRVIVIPSLADDPTAGPYGKLRDPAIAMRLHGVLLGRLALWSGTPDQGSASRTEKDALIKNLATWAAGNWSAVHRPGLVVLEDQSADASARYDWLQSLVGLRVAADTTPNVASEVKQVDETGNTILSYAGARLAYSNMASFGFYVSPEVGSGARPLTATSVGGQVVMLTASASVTSAAEIHTDKADYAPGETVTITGTGFKPGEVVTLTFEEDPFFDAHPPLTSTADSSGNFTNTQFSPDENDISIRFIVTATGDQGSTAQATFTDAKPNTVTVGAQSPDPVTAGGAATFAVTVNFNGNNNNSCTSPLSVTTALPAGATASFNPTSVTSTGGNVNSTLTITTTAGTTPPGTTPITVLAGNGAGCQSGTATNNSRSLVVANTAPTLTGVPTSATIPELALYTFDANATDPEAPPQVLTFSLSGAPTGATIDASTGVLTWTPTEAQGPGPGPYTFSVRVSDGTATTSQSITLTVTEVNSPPTLNAIGDKTVNEAVLLTFTATASDTDVPANTLTFSLVGAPAGATINSSTGVFSWTPTVAQGPGSYAFTVRVNDGTANDDESITVTVNEVNSAPVFTKGANQAVNEDAGAQTAAGWATAIAASAADANESGQTVSFTVTNDNNSLFSAQPAVASNGTLTYTPAPNAFGLATVTVTAKDDGGTTNGGVDTSAPQSFTITVNAVNDAPSFTKDGNQTVNEDAGAQTVSAWATAISAGPANESAQTLTFTVTNDNNTLFSAQPAIAANGNLTYTPAANQFGSATVSVFLKDNGGTANGGVDQSATQTFTITVNPLNDAPTYTKGANQSVDEDAAAQTVVAWATAISAGPANENTQILAFSVTGNTNPSLFSVTPAVNAGTGTLTYTPAPDAFGSATITLRLSDDGGTTNGGIDFSQQTFTITVDAVNDAPTYTKGADQMVNEDAGAQTVVGWATNIIAGPPNESSQMLNFTVNGNTNTALFSTAPSVDESTGTLTYTPATNAFGSATITLRLHDNGGQSNGGNNDSEQTFVITVNSVNDAPTFTKGANQAVNEDAGAQSLVGWATNISAGPANESGQAVSFSVTGNTNAPLFSTAPSVSASTGTLTYTPAANANGSATITLRLSDTGGVTNGGVDFSEQTFTITVNAVNDEPSFTKGADQAVNEDAGAQTVNGWATSISAGPANESSQILTFVVTNNTNAGLFSAGPAVDATGRLTYTPAANANGSATITLKVTDNGGTLNGGVDESPTQTFVINVTAVNDAPTYLKGADQTVLEGASAQTVSAWATSISRGPADESAQTLTFTVTNNTNPTLFSAGPAVDPATGTLTYTPVANANGSATITLELRDNGGTANGGVDASSQTFVITVTAVNDAPSFTKGADQTVLEDAGAQTVNGWATSISAGPANESSQILTFVVTGNTNPTLFSAAPAVDATGKLTYTPAANANGSATITLKVTDNGGTANSGVDETPTQTFVINVTAVNDAPTFDLIGNQTVLEDAGAQSVSNALTNASPGPTNENGQTLTRTVTNDNNGLFSVQPAIDGSGTLTYTPAPNANGSALVSVKLQDDGSTADGGVDQTTKTLTITVSSVNDAPSFTKGADQMVNEDAGAQSVSGWATALSAGPPDESSQTLAFTVTNDNNALFSAQPAVDASGKLTYTPAANAFGAAIVSVSLTDNGGTLNGGVDQSSTQTFTIAVNAVNDAPTYVKGADPTVNEDAGAQTVVGWATAISAGPANENTQTLAFAVTGNTNPSLFLAAPAVDAGTGTLTYTPAANEFGSATITLRLSDNGGTANSGIDFSEQTFTITVNAVNDAPNFVKGADQTVNEDAGAQTANGWATAISKGPANESGQTLTFQVTANTNAGLFSAGPAIDATTGNLTYTPAANANGSATITIALEDDGGTANGGVDTSPTQTFVINVTAVNDAPTYVKGADHTVLEDAGAQTVPAWATSISRGPADESGQTLTFTVTNNTNPTLFAVTPSVDPATGTLTYTPAANANGSTTITLELKDNGGTANGGVEATSQTFVINVTLVNDAPSFVKGADQTVNENASAQSVNGWATALSAGPPDESSQTLTFIVTNDNNALFSVQPAVDASGKLTYTPAASAFGAAIVSVSLTDNGGTANGGVDTSPIQTFVINVTEATSANAYLHGSGGTANPPTLTLNASAPTGTTEKYQDSPAIKFASGNVWTAVGTWSAASGLFSGSLNGLAPVQLWLGLKNSDDQGTNFDVRVEAYKNGALVASGELLCTKGVTRNPSLAVAVAVPFPTFPTPTFNASDVFSLKVLTRVGTNGSGAMCGGHSNAVGLRTYFDAVSRAARTTLNP